MYLSDIGEGPFPPFPLLDDGTTLRLGKAQATCTLTREAQSCGAESPVCEDLMLTIEEGEQCRLCVCGPGGFATALASFQNLHACQNHTDIFLAEAFWDAKAAYTPHFAADGGFIDGPGSSCCASWITFFEWFVDLGGDAPFGQVRLWLSRHIPPSALSVTALTPFHVPLTVVRIHAITHSLRGSALLISACARTAPGRRACAASSPRHSTTARPRRQQARPSRPPTTTTRSRMPPPTIRAAKSHGNDYQHRVVYPTCMW